MKQKLRFHHLGIPTDRALPNADYNADLKIHGTGYFENPYGIEWHNFDPDNDLPDIVKTQPHIAFVVDDLASALNGKEVIVAPRSPVEGVRVAFIFECGMPIELMEFDRAEEDIWPHPGKFVI